MAPGRRITDPTPACTLRKTNKKNNNNNNNKMASAAEQVFQTTELLELVFLFLDTASLLTAASVCHHWRTVAASSLPIQRALFLQPALNRGPLLALGPPGELPANVCHANDLPRPLQPRANDLLIRKFRLGHYEPPDPDYDGGYMPMVSVRWLDGKEGARPSWRRMFLTQPPPRRVEILIDGTDMFQPVKAWVECADGVTAGMIYDKCHELVSGRPWGKRSMGWFFEL